MWHSCGSHSLESHFEGKEPAVQQVFDRLLEQQCGPVPLAPARLLRVSKLADIALALPAVEQGIACAGTALESRTFRVNGKAFLFVSLEHARLKLGASVAEARQQGADVGAGGWTKLALVELPPAAVLRRWIAESHGLMGAGPAPKKAPAARKPASRKQKRS